MIVAQYKDNTHLFIRLTSWWTKGPYSHTEIIFSDGRSGSASFRDKGVRLKKIDYSKNPDRWDFLVPPESWRKHFDVQVEPGVYAASILDTKEKLARAYIVQRDGHKYDVGGLVGFVWQAMRNNQHKDFCSEVCVGALGYPDGWRFNPNLVTSTLLGQGWTLRKGVDLAYRNGIPGV